MNLALRYFKCPSCAEVFSIPAVRARRSFVACTECGNLVVVSPETAVMPPKHGRTDAQKRSRDQERRASKRDGGRVQPGSGSMDHAKGDIHSPGVYRMECKETTAKSFSVKRTILDKISSEATGMETPVLEVEFQGQYPKSRVYVIPEWAWQEYMELKNAANNDNS